MSIAGSYIVARPQTVALIGNMSLRQAAERHDGVVAITVPDPQPAHPRSAPDEEARWQID